MFTMFPSYHWLWRVENLQRYGVLIQAINHDIRDNSVIWIYNSSVIIGLSLVRYVRFIVVNDGICIARNGIKVI